MVEYRIKATKPVDSSGWKETTSSKGLRAIVSLQTRKTAMKRMYEAELCLEVGESWLFQKTSGATIRIAISRLTRIMHRQEACEMRRSDAAEKDQNEGAGTIKPPSSAPALPSDSF